MAKVKTLIAVCGPTASGKTDFAIDLALRNHAEILSADSRQCFKELNIGVAKPSTQQLQAVRHYFINTHSIFDEVDAGVFEAYADDVSRTVFATNNTLVMAGGTGLYVKAFLEGLDEIPEADHHHLSFVRSGYEKYGIEWLTEQLKENDPVFVAAGEMQNPQRMMRALAVKLTTGKSIFDFHTMPKKRRNYSIKKVFLNPPREVLYERINRRVDVMIKQGLADEAKRLHPHRNLNSLQTVGYRELFDHFEGKVSFDEAVELIKRNTRRYAKRQLTWFKKYFVDDDTQIIC